MKPAAKPRQRLTTHIAEQPIRRTAAVSPAVPVLSKCCEKDTACDARIKTLLRRKPRTQIAHRGSRLVETAGIEPATSCMSSMHSNQLSYASEVCRTQNIIAQPEKKCNSKNKIYTKFYFMHGRAPACVPPAELMRNQKSKYINGLYEPSAS